MVIYLLFIVFACIVTIGVDMYTISKIFSFEASHMIEGLPKEHPCTNLHGHSYQVIVSFCSTELNKVGFVIDYRDLDIFKQ